MYTRRTHDYSPTFPGSKAENQAINARREMMKVFDSIPLRSGTRRKSWGERMLTRTGSKSYPSQFQIREPAKQKGLNEKEMFSLEARARFVAPRKAERRAA